MRVDQREIASAPVTHIVRAEPVRTSVIGAGRPVSVRPPAAVVSRQVVAVRTPPSPPRPIEQRQAQAGGHLNEQTLVRPVGPAQPAQVNQVDRQKPSQDGFRPFTQPNDNHQLRQMPPAQSRTNGQPGSAQPENRNVQQPENRNTQPQENRNSQPTNREFRPAPSEQARPVPQETHPLVRPAPPVQERNPQQERQQEQKFNQWHQERSAQPPSQPAHEPRQQSRPPEQKQVKPPKKGR